MNLSERASDAGYAAGWRLVRSLPEGVARRLFDRGADFASSRNGGPDQLRRNLARVLGTTAEQVPDDLIRESVRSYARYWREAFRLPSMDLAAQAAVIDRCVYGKEHLEAALGAGKGVVLALPHSGNWDMAGMWLVRTHGGLSTVAERLKPESLYQRFVAYRESLGFEIFPLSGSEQPPLLALSDRLRQNKVVCLLGERDLAKHGVPVTFFGEPTRMPAGAAKLAIDTGATLLPVHGYFDGDGWGFDISPAVDVSQGVAAATQTVADHFAAGIRAHPADWHMLQPLWMSDWSAERRARIEGT
ncbi:phosphatidylinositol mannoside acyltransferase [Rhodococcus fascians]|nr:phosphatidylinositol mannoside acyltransferase [Rhodococcus fascians]MBY3824826.1 phosphatidylinositol mannoside acyltransferase [Rhodococcus fascians]MBY3835348.1 phosphatidylinositol mannoside acyltransferase [Rhodococcus fascians]MBY3864560.1 phosphatidylinositol mannoside acyltransferase [Rhodococcus fascians]MBY3884031.1 phosphatidylinositol mannoside acyltransferase [Rhodococcus fascians]